VPLDQTVIDSPVGSLMVTVDGGVLRSIDFSRGQSSAARAHGSGARGPGTARGQMGQPVGTSGAWGAAPVVERLRAYFGGDLRALDGIPVDPNGTSFQRDVWRMLQRIPMGRTWSYQELARAIGRPDAIRAVGAANGANPIPIVIPCHRVIGADGRLVGYGGGLDHKRWLLAHEGARLL
jgi:methylated-DNA-[protein]-cysteine S-methyltransferase